MKTANANILVVDDTPANLQLLVGLLKDRGYTVRPAPSGKHALAVAQTQAIDVILLDIMMPEMDGYEVCHRFKAQETTKDIPIIFLSALNDTFNKVKAFEVGGVDYITKPFQAEEVLARVKTHLTIRRLQQELEARKQELEARKQELEVRKQELEARNRELASLVNKDGLTHIANRRYFDACLQQEWRRLTREKNHLALIFIDLDHFKNYNDHYGHQAGDDCLKHVAHVFERVATRPSDVAARYGGEEFVILLPNTNLQGAEHIAEKIREALRQLNIPHAQSTVSSSVTCSMGIACIIPNQDFSADTFVAMADEALYLAKSQGRNQIVSKVAT